jgi:predicted transposase/invertase (TIGR01784 family)
MTVTSIKRIKKDWVKMPNKVIKNPHDKFIKLMMINQKVAREFFEENLPEKIKAIINFDSITPEKESFVKDDLQGQAADILFSAEFGDQRGYLYVIIEHQSTPSEMLPFRILKYVVSIMEDHLKKEETNILPIVFPICIYNGRRNYCFSTDIFDLFGDRTALARDLMFKPFELIDLSKVSDEKLKDKLMYGIVAYAMKHIYEKNILQVVKVVLDKAKCLDLEEDSENDYICSVLLYLMDAGEADRQEFINTVNAAGLPTITEEKIMTLAEQFRQEGEQKGRQEGLLLGLEKGMEKGVEKGKRDIAINLFKSGMDLTQVAKLTGLSALDVEQLKTKITN